MNNTTLSAIFSAIFILVGSWLISRFTCSGSGLGSGVAQFSILDGELNVSKADAFTFGFSGAEAIIPSSTVSAFQKIANHLSNNENRELSLIGNYYSSEKVTDDIDLGMSRAQVVKDKLVELGAPETSIALDSRQLNNVQSGKLLINPVDFSFVEKKTESIKEVMDRPFDPKEPFIIMFESDDTGVEITPELESYVKKAGLYLEKNPTAIFNIMAYTDRNGSAEKIKSWSRSVGRIVRSYLMENGYSRKQVEIIEGGKSNNRRAEIILK